MEYILLLSASFLSATLLPLPSEITLIAYLQQGLPAFSLVLIATLGNTAGACVNWALGRYLLQFRFREQQLCPSPSYQPAPKAAEKWFYFTEKDIRRAQAWFHRYGLWTLTLAWLPIIGDPLTLIAGAMKVKWLPFLLLVGAGKALRYCAVGWVFF